MNHMQRVPLKKITPDPNQPRKQFEGIGELATNMALEGQIHPIEIDTNFQIIVGERRFKAAKLLGWKTINAVVREQPLTQYERLRRQMSENLHQSAAKNGDSMNPLDTARGWAKLYELKTGKVYVPGRNKEQGHLMREIITQLGASLGNTWDVLLLLDEDTMVTQALERGLPRTYIRAANVAPVGFRELIKQKIVAGDYASRDEIRQDVTLVKKVPDLATLALERRQARESSSTNKVLTKVAELALSLEKISLGHVDIKEQSIVQKQLAWIQQEIERYMHGQR